MGARCGYNDQIAARRPSESQSIFQKKGCSTEAVESMRQPEPALTRGLAAISGSDAHYPEHIGRRPFAVELEDGALGRGGQALVEALRAAFQAGRVQASWQAR